MNDIIILSISIIILIVTALLSEIGIKKDKLHPEIGRKILHLTAGFVAAAAIQYIQNIYLIIIPSALITVSLFFMVQQGIFFTIHRRKNRGIFYFSAVYLLLVIVFGNSSRWIVSLTVLILAIPDSAAALAGTFFSKSYYRLTSDKKSVLGSFVFFALSNLLIITFGSVRNIAIENDLLIFSGGTYILTAAFSISVILTAIEAVSSRGLDNLTVPVFGAVLIKIFCEVPNENLLVFFLIGIFLSLVVTLISYRVRFLTADGAVATFLLAGFIFGLGGWKWSIPIMTFFILSSVLSKFRKKMNEEVETFFEKSGVRDHAQVMANGGIGVVFVIAYTFYHSELLYLAYIASLSAVCSDTWATEFGTLRKTKTYNIINFKPVHQGVSGGISIIGLSGAFAGACVIMLSGVFWIEFNLIIYGFITIFSGVLGSLFDSLLGATLQMQNKCGICLKITEREMHCDQKTSYYRGLTWMNNDLVNFFSGIAGAVTIILLKTIV